MARKGENIYKRSDGRYEGRYIKGYTENGKPRFGYVYGKTYAEVKKKLTDRKAGIVKPAEKPEKETLFRDIVYEWMCAAKIRTKESTYARYVALIEAHVLPSLGAKSLEQISVSCIEEYIDSLLRIGRLDKAGGLSSKTVSDILVIIKSILTHADDNGHVVKGNFSRVSVKRKEPEIHVLSDADQTKLIEYLLADTDLYKLGILICLFTGMRLGEICALKWNDVDLSLKIIHVRRTMQRIKNIDEYEKKKTKIVETEPKSQKSLRDIPIPDCLYTLLIHFKTNGTCYCLTGSAETFVEPRKLQYHFTKIIRDCGLQKINYHALRHTFATKCIELGFETKSLSEILGHSNVNITLNRYVHSSFELKRANMNLLSFQK